MSKMRRRDFCKNTLGTGIGISAFSKLSAQSSENRRSLPPDAPPVAIASGNGERAVRKALIILQNKGHILDAVISGVNIVEDDPNDMSVGYGGIPNEEGVVQLDASVMYGPTHSSGAVAALENIKNPSSVARLVMERSDHCLLIGEGALKFARAHGFKEENLLTEAARKVWLKWKESLSDKDGWLSTPDETLSAEVRRFAAIHGTINCCALNAAGDLAGVTTTSGLSFKIPGRVGDSPIIGAGLYVDNAVGAAGSTGRGEANILNLSSFFIVESMRAGKPPFDACLAACRRIVEHNLRPHLRDANGLPNFNVNFYAINKKGEAGGAAIQGGGTMWVGDARGIREIELACLYKNPKM